MHDHHQLYQLRNIILCTSWKFVLFEEFQVVHRQNKMFLQCLYIDKLLPVFHNLKLHKNYLDVLAKLQLSYPIHYSYPF